MTKLDWRIADGHGGGLMGEAWPRRDRPQIGEVNTGTAFDIRTELVSIGGGSIGPEKRMKEFSTVVSH